METVDQARTPGRTPRCRQRSGGAAGARPAGRGRARSGWAGWVWAVCGLAVGPALAGEDLKLPDGSRLVLTAQALQLVDPQGHAVARLPLRGRSLDARFGPDGQGLALVVDRDAERARPVRFDSRAGTLEAQPLLPDARRGIAAACLYRDAQGWLHAFVLAENGIAHQWLLHDAAAARPVREFAVAPEAAHCRADDGKDRLLVSEPGGVWLHAAEPEGGDARVPLALRRPHGVLRQGGGAVAFDGDTVRVQDGAQQRRIRIEPPARSRLPLVVARGQTAPVGTFGDAADDPAIWVHPVDPSASLVLATDKKRGLAVYDLQGREQQFLAVGRLNNVDLRQDVLLGDERLDIAAATQRDEHGLVLFTIGRDRRVQQVARVPLGYPDIYGLCMRRTPQGQAEVIVNDKDGRVLQLRVERDAQGVLGVRRLREFRLASQPEGCVVDDAHGTLFIGEEKRGVWAMSADPADGQASDRRLVLPVGPLLKADVEGLAIYPGPPRHCLVVSSQGNDSYVVLEARPPHRVLGAFRIGLDAQAGIDGVSETDGLDISAAALGPAFPGGLLVVQDGRKRLPEGPQNFKYLAWDDVLQALSLR